jgi:hypothetical protein
MKMRSNLLITLAIVAPLSACGVQRKPTSIRDHSDATLSSVAAIKDYQIGPEWGKRATTRDGLSQETAVVQRASKATVRVRLMFGGATGFVLGERGGKILFATNHHVIEDQGSCDGAKITFEMLDLPEYQCDEVVTTSTDLDLTIFTVKGIADSERAAVLAVAKSFTTQPPKKGAGIVTVGYGVAGNPGQRSLMIGMDADCKVYSPDGETRYMADPDTYNPGPYKTWMFATGCDVSHGDSGSAMVDRTTGEVVGIISTGKIPKNPVVREAAFLTRIFDESAEEVWQELSYAVPASKILEVVGDSLPQ